MTTLMTALKNDDHGFVISAELIIIATIAVLSMIVGLAEVAHGVNHELEDVGSAVGSMNQSYKFSGFTGFKGATTGSFFADDRDECDSECDVRCDGGIRGENAYSDDHDRYNH